MDIDGKKRPLRKDGFKNDVVDNEIILYFPDGDRFLYLNQTSAIIWEQCNGSLRIDEIVAGLEEAFPESINHIKNDVEATIQTFLQNDCITLT